MTTMMVAAERRVSGRALAPYIPRLCRWQVLALAIVAAWALTAWRIGGVTNELQAVWLVRFVVVLGSIGAMFAWDDPSRHVTEAAIGAHRRLVGGRLVALISTVVLAALPAFALAGGELTGGTAAGLAAEAVALVALLSAVALTLQRSWRVLEPAQYVVLTVLLIAIADQATAGRWPLLLGPGQGWGGAHQRWTVLAVVSLAVCAWQMRDPAAPRLRPVLRRGNGG